MEWSDGEQRDPEQEALLVAKQEAFARAVAPYQFRETQSLRSTKNWLKRVVAELPAWTRAAGSCGT